MQVIDGARLSSIIMDIFYQGLFTGIVDRDGIYCVSCREILPKFGLYGEVLSTDNIIDTVRLTYQCPHCTAEWIRLSLSVKP